MTPPDPKTCPSCRRPLVRGWSCPWCKDGVCACGRPTGSHLISQCMACQLAEERKTAPEVLPW